MLLSWNINRTLGSHELQSLLNLEIRIMTINADAPQEKPEDANKTPLDYDEYGYEPQQDEESPKPDEALTDPA
jgi:hypothetical protein